METIFKDLGMYHTVPDKAKPLIYNRARGYSYNKRGKLLNSPPVNLSHKWAGGGFLSDVGDLVQFGNAMVYSYQYTEKHRGKYSVVFLWGGGRDRQRGGGATDVQSFQLLFC